MILVIAEQRDGKLNRATLGNDRRARSSSPARRADHGRWCRAPASAAVAAELAAAQVEEVVTVEHAALEPYTPDGYTAALQQAIGAAVAVARAAAAHLSDARLRAEARGAARSRAHHRRHRHQAGGGETRVRAADVPGQADRRRRAAGPGAALRHVPDRRLSRRPGRAGARRRRRCARSTSPSTPSAIRQKPEAPFQEAKQAVDLSQAERIVSVGRGIKGQANIALAQQLAEALGAELAASRPICDAGWLPMERQVGSSGQTVAPKLYLALGISGAIQHLVGMKGSQHHRRDQQGSRRADLRGRRLRHRRRPVRDRPGDDRGGEELKR